MKEMKNIIDTWNMIEKYNLVGCVEKDCGTILVPNKEYERLLNSVKNKQYIKNITRVSSRVS